MTDSHTNFDGRSFGACAFGGACLLASALGAGLQAAARRNASEWANWNRHQLETALNLSETLREYAYERAERAEGELRKQKMLAFKRTRGRSAA